MSTSLTHISFYFPAKILTNSELTKEFNVEEEKILKSTGIKKRYISAPDELASDLACKAAEIFFKEHKIDRSTIDFIIFCSECYDYIAPATSCVLQDRLGIPKTAGCVDLPYGCSGYVYGLAMAKSFVHSGMARNVLFIVADTPTKTLPVSDLELRSIFSDAAAVSLVNEKNYKDIGEFVFGTDGSGIKNLYCAGSAFREGKSIERNDTPYGRMVMDGMEILNFGLRVVPQLVKDTIEKNKLKFDDIDLFIFHQPTRFLLEVLRKKINIPEEKFFINIEEHGNTVSVTIPLALKDAEKKGKLKKGMNVLLAGFGIGYSWAGTIIKT